MANFNLDISIDKFVSQCNEDQKSELIRRLIEYEDLTLLKLLNNKYIEPIGNKKYLYELSFDTEISPDDYLYECSEREKEGLVRSLSDLDYIMPERIIGNEMSESFDYALESLKGKKNFLSKEQEDYILKLASENNY
jgi:hypothetical protein